MIATWLLGVSLAWAGVTVQLPSSGQDVTFDDSASAAVEAGMVALAERRLGDASRIFRDLADAGGNAHARYLAALSYYEAGDLRMAKKQVAQGLARDKDHGPLRGLEGLVLADVGRGDEAIAALKEARRLAEHAHDDALLARTVLNTGLVRLDQGALAKASERFAEAASLGEAAQDAAVVAQARENLSVVAAMRGQPGASDEVGRVADRIRRGDISGARKSLPTAQAWDRRGTVRGLLASAMVDRAAGRLDQANLTLRAALEAARVGGLVRETAACLAELGVIYSLAGHFDTALASLHEAIGLVAGTSFRLNEVSYRVEAGRVAVRLGDLSNAAAQLQRATAVQKRTEDALGGARLSELDGAIAARRGELARANAAYTKALTVWEGRGHWSDAARVATDLVEANAAADPNAAKSWAKKARSLFKKAGNTSGDAHVDIARGLGLARAGAIGEALEAFTEAAAAGERAGTSRGRQLAMVARQNGAEALEALGHGEEAVAAAKAHGLEGALRRYKAFGAAEDDYAAGLRAFDGKRYQDARDKFSAAEKAFLEIGESGYASTSRKGRAWASYNVAVDLKPDDARRMYAEVVRDAEAVGDPELGARAAVGQAMAEAKLGQSGAPRALEAAAERAERMGLDRQAGSCWAEVVSTDTTLDRRIVAARRAHALLGVDNGVGVYSVYSVAVDAFNAGDFEMALQLAEELRPNAGDLSEAVDGVIEGARAAMQAEASDEAEPG